MSSRDGNAKAYFDAARRKVRIAEYHLEELTRRLSDAPKPRPSDLCPTIPIQAHFEGIVISVMATVDQIAQAINEECDLKASPGDLFDKAYSSLAPKIARLKNWCEKLIGRDLRRIRTRVAHYQYSKIPLNDGQGDPHGWQVEDAGVGYDGSRELGAYGRAAILHARELIDLIPAVQSEIGRQTGEA
jgi:hypothetical protein